MNEIISYGRFHCRELTPHKNRGMEITFIEKGMLEWMVEGQTEKVEAGSVFFTLPWQVHGSLNASEPENTIWHVLFRLEQDYDDAHDHFRFPKAFGFNPEEMKVLSGVFCAAARHCHQATPVMKVLMPMLIRELESTHELRDTQAITLLRAILVELKRIVAREVQTGDRPTRSEQRVQYLIQALSSSCGSPWTLKEMAARCGIQRTQLARVFQKLTGSTPMEYLARIRIEQAKILLRETDRKIIDIALDCGFGSSQYFSNTFRRATGQSPTDYRTRSNQCTVDDLERWKGLPFRSENEERERIRRFESP